MIVEYSHRVLAGIVAIMIAYLAWTAWRRRRSERLLVRVSIAAFGLILFQAALGGLTVEKGLEEELVATHLGVAMLQIGLVLLMARLGGPDPVPSLRLGGTRVAADPDARWRSSPCSARSWPAATCRPASCTAPGRSTAPSTRTWPAATTSRPAAGEFLPFGRSTALDIHLTHRAFMYVAVTILLVLFAVVMRQRRRLDPDSAAALTRLGLGIVGVMLLQVLLGAVNVWAGEHAWLIVAHLTVGALLWISLVLFAIQLTAVPEPSPAGARRRKNVEAVPA